LRDDSRAIPWFDQRFKVAGGEDAIDLRDELDRRFAGTGKFLSGYGLSAGPSPDPASPLPISTG
jgi:hypothetical protein